MKRYASHFFFLPEYGYWKQCVVETEGGFVIRLFQLTEEIEDVEWLPGAIILLNYEDYSITKEFTDKFFKNVPRTYPPFFTQDSRVIPIYFPNFDIKTMLPVAGTRHKQLL